MQGLKRKRRRGERIRSVFASLCFVSFFVQHGESMCANTDFEARDSRGGYCHDGTYDSGVNCGRYDDVDFTANLHTHSRLSRN